MYARTKRQQRIKERLQVMGKELVNVRTIEKAREVGAFEFSLFLSQCVREYRPGWWLTTKGKKPYWLGWGVQEAWRRLYEIYGEQA